jgi:putative aldouronate transport system permease protein
MQLNQWHRIQKKLGNTSTHLFMAAISLACVLPLILVISSSFSEEADIARYGYAFIPRQFTTYAYEYVFKVPTQIIQSYGVSTFVTVTGSAISLLMMSLIAYVLSRPSFALRKQLSFFVFFTMLFNGGLVPWYIWLTQGLGLKDNIWALVVPYLVVPWYVLLLRTYFAQVPEELLDAARIDGAGEWRIFFQVVMPLSTPALATIGLFCILMYWNDWYLALLFINDAELQPLQYMLYTILTNAQAMAANPMTTGIRMPIATVRMAMAVLATGPAALVFLLVQRYFIRGITLGALK